MQRDDLLKHWNDAWTGGLWAAPWSKAIDDLTPVQAAWSPSQGRHSIWQIVNHMIFWRDDALRALTNTRAKELERERRNFEAPAEISPKAWDAVKRRFAETQQQVRDAIADPRNPLERLQYLTFHDSYHIGQIMYLRSMQGLKPIE